MNGGLGRPDVIQIDSRRFRDFQILLDSDRLRSTVGNIAGPAVRGTRVRRQSASPGAVQAPIRLVYLHGCAASLSGRGLPHTSSLF